MKRILLCCLAIVLGACAGKPIPKAEPPASHGPNHHQPLLAIWRDYDGVELSPRVRVLIWNDGRVLFSKTGKDWGTNLYEGRLTATEMVALKQKLRATGVFRLSQTSLEPDEPICNLRLDFGDEKQFLTWDERGLEHLWNHDPKLPPTRGYLRSLHDDSERIPFNSSGFRLTWVNVSKIALDAMPQSATKSTSNFVGAPISWYAK